MSVLPRYILCGIVIALVLIVFNCKDLGTVAPLTGFRSSSANVTVVKAFTVPVSLSGGTTPYSITRQPSALIATAILNSSTLVITGVDTGQTSIVVSDSKSPIPDTVEIQIIVVTQPPTQSVSFAGQIQPIFNANCTGCHGTNGGLTLTAGVSYSQLYHVPASSSCTSLHRVFPNDANNSVLYLKVVGSTCGSRMPQGGSLSQTEINLIRDWINQGASNN
jgi:hypothetical protein